MLNPIEKFKVAILHLNRAWNHCRGQFMVVAIVHKHFCIGPMCCGKLWV